jgi:hypothetical protein
MGTSAFCSDGEEPLGISPVAIGIEGSTMVDGIEESGEVYLYT